MGWRSVVFFLDSDEEVEFEEILLRGNSSIVPCVPLQNRFSPLVESPIVRETVIDEDSQPSTGVAETRTPETVVDVFPMTDDAEIPGPGGWCWFRSRLVELLFPSRTGIRTAQTVWPGVERVMENGANSVGEESHRASVMRRRLVLTSSGNPTAEGDPTVHTPLRETVLETEGHATGSMPRSDVGTLAPAEPVVEDGGEELGNSSGGDEENR